VSRGKHVTRFRETEVTQDSLKLDYQQVILEHVVIYKAGNTTDQAMNTFLDNKQYSWIIKLYYLSQLIHENDTQQNLLLRLIICALSAILIGCSGPFHGLIKLHGEFRL